MVQYSRIIADPEGLHARPAGLLVQCARECASDIRIEANGKTADAKRIFSIMSLCAKHNDELKFLITGEHEKEDSEKIKKFCEANL